MLDTQDRHKLGKVKGHVLATLPARWEPNPSAGLQNSSHYVVQPRVASEAKDGEVQYLKVTLHAWSAEMAFAKCAQIGCGMTRKRPRGWVGSLYVGLLTLPSPAVLLCNLTCPPRCHPGVLPPPNAPRERRPGLTLGRAKRIFFFL